MQGAGMYPSGRNVTMPFNYRLRQRPASRSTRPRTSHHARLPRGGPGALHWTTLARGHVFVCPAALYRSEPEVGQSFGFSAAFAGPKLSHFLVSY